MSTERNDGGPAFPLACPADFQFAADGMSLREYAAIHLRVPNSGTDWLDDMIREAKRDELAGRAMQELMTECMYDSLGSPLGTIDQIFKRRAEIAYGQADAMLAARKGGAE